jgi:DNA-binding XRE family transcriptional regulator
MVSVTSSLCLTALPRRMVPGTTSITLAKTLTEVPLPQPEAKYPPRLFHSRLPQLLAERGHDDYWLAHFLQVTPVTANRIKNGRDVKLSYALRLAAYFKVSIENIWAPLPKARATAAGGD